MSAHPWMANSRPPQAAMLDAVGASEIEELFEQIPAEHRLARPLELPPALRSEADAAGATCSGSLGRTATARRT